MRRSRGNILLVLVIGALAAALAAVVAGLSLNQLNLATQAETRGRMDSASDSVIALALAELQDDPDFGEVGHAEHSRLFTWTGPAGEVGKLTFDPAVAAAEGIEVSVNNVNGDQSVDAGTRRVPRGMVLLRGGGAWGEASGTMESLVHRPPFPYAISASGRVQISGTSTVGQLPLASDAGDFPAGNAAAGEELLPAHIKATGDIDLNGNVLIQGDVRSGGTVRLGGAAQVRGDVVNAAGPISVQNLDVRTFDHPPGSFEPILGSFLNSTTLVGRHRFSGPGGLLIDGRLELNDAVLFVDGDLTIRSGLVGNGAVITTGQLTIQGNTRVVGLDRAAVVAEGPILLQGISNSQFQGTVYSNSNILARQITVSGAIIGGGQSGSDVSLENSILAQADGSVDLSIKRQGFHRSAAVSSYPTVSDFGPQNYSYLEEAEMITPGRVRLRRMSYHPLSGTRELGLGDIDLTSGTFITGSGDLSDTTRARGAQSVINVLNSSPSGSGTYLEPGGHTVFTTARQVLHYINYFHNNPHDDFAWIQDRFPPNLSTSAHTFQFDPNQVLAPGERMKIVLRRRRP